MPEIRIGAVGLAGGLKPRGDNDFVADEAPLHALRFDPMLPCSTVPSVRSMRARTYGRPSAVKHESNLSSLTCFWTGRACQLAAHALWRGSRQELAKMISSHVVDLLLARSSRLAVGILSFHACTGTD